MIPVSLRNWLSEYWLVVLTAAFLVLLPFSRSAEIPLSILALLAPVLLILHRDKSFSQGSLGWVLLLFLAFAAPMLISSLDSYAFDKSWLQSVASLRFLMAAVTLTIVACSFDLHRRLQPVLALVILFWAVDAIGQFLLGYNLLHFPANPERLGGVFGDDIWFFGPTLAMLSPLAFEWLWKQRRRWLTVSGFLIIPAAVMLSGMRAGWLLLPIIALFYAFRLWRLNGRAALRPILLAALIGGLGAAVIIQQSPLVQQRIAQSLQVVDPAQGNLQHALSQRWLIWQTSFKMIQAHPINGVGVRAFPDAYPDFATADDPQLLKHGGFRGARHAHNVWLEALTDCGFTGLAGLLIMCWILLRLYRRASVEQRQLAWPYLFCICLIMFPFNTHFSLYGTFLSSTLWWLLGLCLAALFAKQNDFH